jgi:hypothetical protein
MFYIDKKIQSINLSDRVGVNIYSLYQGMRNFLAHPFKLEKFAIAICEQPKLTLLAVAVGIGNYSYPNTLSFYGSSIARTIYD